MLVQASLLGDGVSRVARFDAVIYREADAADRTEPTLVVALGFPLAVASRALKNSLKFGREVRHFGYLCGSAGGRSSQFANDAEE